MSQNIDEHEIQNVLQGMMEFLCQNAKNNATTDFELDQIRLERFSTISNKDYFNRIVAIIAERFIDIELRGSKVRLSSAGLDNCKKI
jgi:hypothetical protein